MTATVPEIIKQRLHRANITEAAIVDETFDGISNEAIATDLTAFITAIEGEAIFDEIKSICGELEDPDDFDLDSAKKLWAKRDSWGENLRHHADLLFNVYSQRLQTLDRLASSLQLLGLQVHRLGAHTEVPTTVGLVFLDYYLQPEKETLTSVQGAEEGATAKLLAEAIAARLADRGVNRPFLVLISDRADVNQVHDAFRKRTSYLGGTFVCLAKSKAADQEALYFHIGCWGIGHAALVPIAQFFDAVASSLEQTAAEFRQTLLTLDAHDYSFIQRHSLSATGETLGEYMLKMIGAALSHRVRSEANVVRARASLDEQFFESHLPSRTQPSAVVRKLYQDSITEPEPGDLAPHPLHKLQTPPPKVFVPRLVLGDVLLKSANEPVFMVSNAACDLQFSPTNPERYADPEAPIYLLPGKLELLTQSLSNTEGKRTELFEVENNSYRILWDHKHVRTVPLGELERWCKEHHYRRVDRLAPVYAVSIQQVWTADLGRVGVMVTPPFAESADFQVYLRDDAEGNLRPFGSRITGEIILGNQRRQDSSKECFLVTRNGMFAIHQAMKEASKRLEGFTRAIPDKLDHSIRSQRVADFRRQTERVDSVIRNWNLWFALLEQETDLERKKGSRKLAQAGDQLPITFCWQAYPEGQNISSYGAKNCHMVVDILRPEALPPKHQIAECGLGTCGPIAESRQTERAADEAAEAGPESNGKG